MAQLSCSDIWKPNFTYCKLRFFFSFISCFAFDLKVFIICQKKTKINYDPYCIEINWPTSMEFLIRHHSWYFLYVSTFVVIWLNSQFMKELKFFEWIALTINIIAFSIHGQYNYRYQKSETEIKIKIHNDWGFQ